MEALPLKLGKEARGGGGNPKSEIRDPKEIRNPKPEIRRGKRRLRVEAGLANTRRKPLCKRLFWNQKAPFRPGQISPRPPWDSDFGGLRWTSMDFGGPKIKFLLISKREGRWYAPGKGGAVGGGSGTPAEYAGIVGFGMERDKLGQNDPSEGQAQALRKSRVPGGSGGMRGVAGGFGDKIGILMLFEFLLWRQLSRSGLSSVQALLFAKSGTKWRTGGVS